MSFSEKINNMSLYNTRQAMFMLAYGMSSLSLCAGISILVLLFHLGHTAAGWVWAVCSILSMSGMVQGLYALRTTKNEDASA